MGAKDASLEVRPLGAVRPDERRAVPGLTTALSAFVAAQRRWLSTQSRLYLTLNLVGVSVLTVLAAHERLLGFFLLEFVWALVAAHSLVRSGLGRADPR